MGKSAFSPENELLRYLGHGGLLSAEIGDFRFAEVFVH